ncbi:transposase domain-containing protein, partial [Devosia sp. A369]
MIPAAPQQLPDDVDVLKAMIAAAHAEIAELKVINTTSDERIARLTSIIAMLQRAQYGTRSERLRHDLLDDEQMAFVFDEIETGIGEIEAGLAARDRQAAAPRASRPRKGFAPHLERIEQVIEPEVPADCVGLEAVRIGEDVSERLDVTPTRFRVIVTRRPKYAYRLADGEDRIVQAPAPDHLIAGGIPTEALLAQVAVSKYADGLPLYRQEEIYGRDGVELDRSLMAQWMGRLGFELEPL